MKTFLFCSLLLFITATSYSQHSLLTVFSDDGEHFFLYVDGKKINDIAKTHVEGVVLKNDIHKIKVDGEFDKTINASRQLESKDMDGNYCRLTLCLKMVKSGKYKLKLSDFTPLSADELLTETTSAPVQEVVVEKEPVKASTAKTVQVKDVTQSDEDSATVSFSMDANSSKKAEVENVSVNFSANDENGKASVSFSVSTSESNMNSNVVVTEESEVISTKQTSNSESVVQKEVEKHPMPEYNGKKGCNNLIWDKEFEEIKGTIRSKNFEETKLSIAKDIASKKCLQAKHVHDIMKLFKFEESRLQFAMFAYTRTYDQDNYYKVYNAFEFEMTIEELKAYINGDDGGLDNEMF